LEPNADSSVQTEISPTAFPFLGKVRGKNVNVRSGSNVNYEIIARVQEGQEVIALSQVFDWYQILPPEGTSFWVHQDYIRNSAVTSDAVNVRSAPSLGGSISGQLNRGDIVEAISHEGEWIRIQPPVESRAWIHKDYVVYDKPYGQDLKAIELQKKENLINLRKTQLLKEASEFEESEFFKPVDQTNFDEIANKYQMIAKEFPDDQALQAEIKKKLEAFEVRKSKTGVVSSSVETVGPVSQPAISVDRVPSSDKTLSEPVTSQDRVTNSYEVMVEGKVEADRRPEKTKRYKLIQNRRRICFLKEKDFSLKAYLHQNVRIYGKRVSWVYPRIPVIEVEKIEALH
jgi:uncharacterized protein YgiM (DUF1202 family)